MKLKEYFDSPTTQSSLIGSLLVGGLIAGAVIVSRKGAEHSWTAIANRPPPNKRHPDDTNLKDAVIWAALFGAVAGLARFGVHRAVGDQS